MSDKPVKLISVTGPAGAGKDTAAFYLADKLGYTIKAGGDLLRDMLRKLGLQPTKEAVSNFGLFLRSNYGPSIIVGQAVMDDPAARGIITVGIRSPAETQVVKDKGGVVCFIDAPELLRHDRLVQRNRPGDELKSKNLHALDAKETAGHTGLEENLDTVRTMSDTVIVNDGSLADLHAKLDAFCEEFIVSG